MVEEIDFENGRISMPRDLDLDLESSHMAYRRASVISLRSDEKIFEGHILILPSSKSHDTKTRTDIKKKSVVS